MKQKLGSCLRLVMRPELLLLDEPSVGVDPISRRELWKMVYELVDEGIGVVWSTAYLDEAQRCSDVLLLDRGRALYAGPPDELTARARGRTFLIQGAGPSRRQVLAKALNRPDVVDATIQGNSIRLVVKARGKSSRSGHAGPGQSATESLSRRGSRMRTSTCWEADRKAPLHWPDPRIRGRVSRP